MRPEKLWWWSCRLHRRGLTPLARLVKTANMVLFSVSLPFECEISPDVRIWHRGLGVVIHPSTTIGRGVQIGHGVTVAAGSADPITPWRVTIEDGVTLGAHSFVAARFGSELRVGSGAVVGAHAVVTRDVPPGAVMVGPRAVDMSAESTGVNDLGQ